MSPIHDGRASDRPAHVPVMLDEVMAALAPAPGDVHVDGTFGAGGYTRAILAAGAHVVAIDRDPSAIAAGRALAAAYPGRLDLVEGRFGALDGPVVDLGRAPVQGVVLDVGVSSMQLDEAERGFSFRFDGPLDMRMSGVGESAADVVNTYDEAMLARLFWVYGEEKRANALARAIVQDRVSAPFLTTRQLADLCGRVVGRARRDDIHPATRAFQALRIHVNGELDELAEALSAAERILGEGGRLVVVSFHSLEDRIVKRFLADRSREGLEGSRHGPQTERPPATFRALTKGALNPSESEARANPRARSAKLRAGWRTAAAPRAPDHAADKAALGVPDIRPTRRRP